MLTELSAQNIGYTKSGLHEALKPILFKKFIEFPHYFNNQKYNETTTALTLDGWQALIEELKVFSADIFNYAF